MNEHEEIRLHIPGDVARRLEGRSIREEDAQKVIFHAETTGKKVVNPATGRFLSFFRPKAVTYWVEYRATEDACDLFTAYSHRMVMKSSGSTGEWVKSGSDSEWHCHRCRVPLEVQTVRLQYMQSIFAINLPACSQCGFILIDEELATGKIAEAEQALEDK